MTYEDRRPIERVEDLNENVGIGIRSYRLYWNGRGSESREVGCDAGQALE